MNTTDAGLLLARIVVGSFMMKHGSPKLRDTDGEYAKSFESLGFRPGATFVRQAAIVETLSGALIITGALGPVGPMLLLSDMIVAGTSVAARQHTPSLFKHELESVYATIAVLFALAGYGSASVDRAIGLDSLDKSWLRVLSIAAGFTGAVAMLAQRTPPSKA
jgi:uncharacterized membrane protein YphA (DoxX/SURF4 family)